MIWISFMLEYLAYVFLGLIIGIGIGIFVLGLCVTAKLGDIQTEDQVPDIENIETENNMKQIGTIQRYLKGINMLEYHDHPWCVGEDHKCLELIGVGGDYIFRVTDAELFRAIEEDNKSVENDGR